MKTTLRSIAALTTLAASTALFAHPGNHESLTASEQAAHVVGDPWHVAMTITVTIAALAVIRSLRRNPRRDR